MSDTKITMSNVITQAFAHSLDIERDQVGRICWGNVSPSAASHPRQFKPATDLVLSILADSENGKDLVPVNLVNSH